MKHKGFTLVELLVVIAVIGILATLVLGNLSESRRKAKDTAIVGELRNLQTSVEVTTGATGGYTNICDLFEPGGDLELYRTSIETKGGIWSDCVSDDSTYAVTVILNSGQLVDRSLLGTPAYAQGLESENEEEASDVVGVHSAEELLLSDADILELKRIAKENSEKFRNPRYYCVGAIPGRDDEGSFRRGYLYSLPTSGCGAPVASPTALIDAYDSEDEPVAYDDIIKTYSCPISKAWETLAAQGVIDKVITQSEIDNMLNACNDEEECVGKDCGPGEGGPTKYTSYNWYCPYEVNFTGTYTGCGESNAQVWVDESLCSQATPKQCK